MYYKWRNVLSDNITLKPLELWGRGMNSDFSAKKILTGEESCVRPFTVLSGCLRHFLLSVVFFRRKRLYCAAPSYGRCGRRKKRRFSVLFIDWEAQYQWQLHTFWRWGRCIGMWRRLFMGGTPPDYGKRCLSVSAGMDCWEPGVEWVRQPPDDAITDIRTSHFIGMPWRLKNLFRHFLLVCR